MGSHVKSTTMMPIGRIRSCFPEKFGIPKQGVICPSSEGHIEFSPHIDVVAMTAGLESFSHLWILWLFHQNKNKSLLKKIHPPRLEGKKAGIFSSRSPHRPNPIGMTVVKIMQLTEKYIFIGGLDMVDKTPVLDIKPYIPQWDSFPEATSGWLTHKPERHYEVNFSPQSLMDLSQLAIQGFLIKNTEEVKTAISECLSIDPRPRAYIKMDETLTDNQKPLYAFRIFNLDVKFRWLENRFIITQIDFVTDPMNTNEDPSPL